MASEAKLAKRARKTTLRALIEASESAVNDTYDERPAQNARQLAETYGTLKCWRQVGE